MKKSNINIFIGIKQYNGIWRKIQSFLSPKPFQDPDRKFINPYDRNLTRPLTSKPVVGTLLSPILGILQDELITGIVWWKIVFGFLFVLVTGAANWIFL